MVVLLKDSQRIVNYFIESLNLKVSGSKYKTQLGIANSLLKDYTIQEIYLVIDYIKEFPQKSRIYSLGYLKYIIDDVLPKAKALKLKREKEALTQFTNERLNVTNTRKESNSLLKKGRF